MSRFVEISTKLIVFVFSWIILGIIGLGIYNTGKFNETDNFRVEKKLDTSAAPLSSNDIFIPKQSLDKLIKISKVVRSNRKNVVKRKSRYSDKTHISLQDTCDRWTNWYNKKFDEISRINMNVSCRDAANYANNNLNINHQTPNFVAKTNEPYIVKAKSNKIKQPSNRKSMNCSSWKLREENIRNQLKEWYREPTGNDLRRKRRELSQLIYKNC